MKFDIKWDELSHPLSFSPSYKITFITYSMSRRNSAVYARISRRSLSIYIDVYQGKLKRKAKVMSTYGNLPHLFHRRCSVKVREFLGEIFMRPSIRDAVDVALSARR